MARHSRQRWAIFAHDPDGDTEEGVIVGPFLEEHTAIDKADKITRTAEKRSIYLPNIECIVVAVMPGGTGVNNIINMIDS